MDFGKSLEYMQGLFQSHPYIGIAAVVVLLVLIYLRPMVMLRLAMLVAIVIAMIYVGEFLIDLTQTGIHEQEKFLDKPRLNLKNL